jgi:hypothetical protein
MHHAITHTLVGLAIMLPFALLGHYWTGALIASSFYGSRELYQYYILHKRHNGRFDHEGWIPVTLITLTIAGLLSWLLN